VRNCEVKAIKIFEDKAQIVEDKCIGCGQCFVVCPQNARNIKSDIQIIKNAIKNNKNIVVSVAPSVHGIYDDAKKVVCALKKLGFSYVEETAIGADISTKLYKEHIENNL